MGIAAIARFVLGIIAVVTVAAALITDAASAATTPFSSFHKTGTDRQSGSTASSAPASNGATQGGDTIDWILHYRKVPDESGFAEIRDELTAGHTFVPGSLRAPIDFAPGWSTDGGLSYSGAEPAAGVNALVARGPAAPGGVGRSTNVPPPSNGFASVNAAGDGWEAIFWDDDVYNVYHHNGGQILDCHSKTTGNQCPGYPHGVPGTAGQPFAGGSGFITPTSNYAALDDTTGRLYMPVGRNNSTETGVLCADLSAQTSCGFTKLYDATQNNTGNVPQIGAAEKVGSRVYVIGEEAKVYCYDIPTDAPCAGYPVTALTPTAYWDVSATAANIRSYDDRRLFVNFNDAPNAGRELSCIDTTTNAVCPGFPVVQSTLNGYQNQSLIPVLDAAGAQTGICGADAPDLSTFQLRCFDFAGNSIPNPYPYPPAVGCLGSACNGGVAVVGTKVYLPIYAETGAASGTTSYSCFDFATGAKCAGFDESAARSTAPPDPDVRPYTVAQDPYRPDCLWSVGHHGIFEVFDAVTGRRGCPSTTAVVSVRPADFYCDGAGGHAQGWNEIVLVGMDSADYREAVVTISDASGPLAGWDRKQYPNTTQRIDISSLPLNADADTLEVSVDFNGANPGITGRIALTFDGDPIQVCFSTTVDSTCSAATITNRAVALTTLDGGLADWPGGNDSGAASFSKAVDPAACPDLSVTKTAPPTALPRDQITYSLDVTNHGPIAATNVTVTDSLPAGLRFDSATPSQGACTEAGGNVTCNLGTLAANATASVDIKATVRDSAADSTITNTTQVAADQPDRDPASDNDSAVTAVGPLVDVEVQKTAPATVFSNESFDYQLVVANNGPSGATGVVVTDALPAGTLLGASAVSQGTCTEAAGTLTCQIGALASGASATITISVRAEPGAAGSTVTNTADSARNERDSDPANDSDSAPTQVLPSVDLKIEKTGTPAAVFVGERVTYTLAVENLGPNDATGVVVTDDLPADLAYVSATPDRGTCTEATGKITCALGNLAVGGKGRVTVVAEALVSGGDRDVVNKSAVAGNEHDPDTANSASDASTRINRSADLSIEKKALVDSTRVWGEIPYEITVSNAGPSVADDVLVTDYLPDGARLVKAEPDRGVCFATEPLRCDVGDLAAGESATVSVVIQATTAGTYKNVATVESPVHDPSTPGNEDAVETPVNEHPPAQTQPTQPQQVAGDAQADEIRTSLRKTRNRRLVRRGRTVLYKITYRNRGDSSVRVRLCDVLPRHTNFVSASGRESLRNGRVCWRTQTVRPGRRIVRRIRLRIDRTAPRARIRNVATADTRLRSDPDVESVRSRNTALIRPTGRIAGRRGGVTG